MNTTNGAANGRVNMVDRDGAIHDLGALYALEPNAMRERYDIYARVREAAPISRIGPIVSVARYGDIKNVLRDPETFSSIRSAGKRLEARKAQLSPEQIPMLDRLVAHGDATMTQTDDPRHARLRRFVNDVFSAARIAETRSRLEDISERLLDDIDRQNVSRVDIIEQFTFKLPLAAICALLGVPDEEVEQMRHWGGAINTTLGTDYSNVEEAYDALRHFEHYVQNVVTGIRRGRATDNALIAALLTPDDDGNVLSETDMVALFVQLLISGNVNTLMANALITLDEHPDQAAILRSEPKLIRGAIEEMFRYRSSIHAIHRVATRDTEIAGFPVHEGESVRLLLAAANRDPEKFVNPDHFDVRRKNARQHLGLGFGIHTCLGQWLSRLDIDVGLNALYRRYRNIVLDGPVEYMSNFTMYGPEQLFVRLEHA